LKPAAVQPVRIYQVDAGTLGIDWSDGHSTGIYTYEYLRALCPCARCRAGV